MGVTKGERERGMLTLAGGTVVRRDVGQALRRREDLQGKLSLGTVILPEPQTNP